MPFTVSHISAVILFTNRRWLSLSGLIVGSMIPDFEYFLRMALYSKYSHTLEGVFLFDLPVGLAFCFIYHLVCKKFIIDNSPEIIRSRMIQYRDFDWINYFKQRYFIVIISIVIGSLTHVIWDSFTHGSGYFVQEYQFLRTRIPVFNTSFPVFYIYQHLSTIIGLAFFVKWFISLEVNNVERKSGKNGLKVFFVMLILFFATRMSFMAIQHEIKIGHVIVIFIASGMYSCIVSGIFYSFSKRYKI
ncbi:DUF4184 family protein [Marinigracilibium pacificum]|uniref:DUF4184 family protein n=1 Tax=Marinigracilibium pacificum TaxID=2729599 RepID=A0A848J012_9BACT|nr:DUF4184 family protein [Marinigracilibium pacificum]NMM48865.1 DUF4184 family protein [Marinigracilibium pacificum]